MRHFYSQSRELFLKWKVKDAAHQSRWPFFFFVLTFAYLLTAVPALAAFTIVDENKLGKEFYDRLLKHNMLIQDEKVNQYINRLGQTILARSSNVLFTFRFSVIKSSAINAFATPGGYVYVNRGLIILAQNEDELAGVLAHEIAHVNSRHIARNIEQSQRLSMATLATVLAGVFLGGGTGTEAALGLSLATSTHLSLKYSRENEEEADRLGMSYLVGAGYDGKGMLSFMKSMKNFEYYSSSLPSYFLTHPGTDERIKYMDALLQSRYGGGGATSIVGGFGRFQTNLMLGEGNLDRAAKYFQDRLDKNPDDADALYGLAVTQSKRGQSAESFANFSKALRLSLDDVDVLREFGQSYFNAGRFAEAIGALRRAYSLDEKDDGTLLYLGRAYEETGNYTAALDFYKKYQMKNPGDVNILYNIAMTYGKINDQVESHYYFAIFFKKKHKPDSAKFHLKEAQKFVSPNSDREKDILKELDSLRR